MDLLAVVQLERLAKEMLEEMLPHVLVEAEVVLLLQVLQEQVHLVPLQVVLEVMDQLQVFLDVLQLMQVVAGVLVLLVVELEAVERVEHIQVRQL
tara:strand:+ start:77 stop:361 length:285 start_codon:yes stop_codon:yes gene_type:complete